MGDRPVPSEQPRPEDQSENSESSAGTQFVRVPGPLPQAGAPEEPSGAPEGSGDGSAPTGENADATLTPGAVLEEPELELLSFPLVAIGASAGGLEACRDLLKTLPANTGLAFVLISHLAPDQKSHLVEILASHTGMAVAPVEDGLRPEPDHFYILPPNQFASISRGRLHLEPRPEGRRVPMPIDYFFRSLAVDQKNRAIGVILSGADSDGALGLKAIKGEGGIAIVQAPESARHPGMPRSSIAADHVDLVLPPAEIGHELGRIGRQFMRPEVRRLEELLPQPATEDQQFNRILLLLGTVSGIDFRQYKPATIRRRVARRMMMNRVANLHDYLRHLGSHDQELRKLHEDVLINVTHFFRDPDVWQVFKTHILPTILKNRPGDSQIRVWVPGCSTGEEVYTIAICLLEFLSGTGEEPPIQIFGTDASERLVQTARAGIYAERIAEDVSPERIRCFFVKSEKHFQISKRVRDLCIFARQNLCNDPPFSRLDLVSCRNVLIYFNQTAQKQILPVFHYALRPNGILLLGTSETLREYPDLFSSFDRKHKFYRKMPAANLVRVDIPRHADAARAEPGVEPAGETLTESELQRAADRIVLARYGPAGVVVNERMEIMQSRGHTSPYLEMAPGASSFKLMRMVRDSIAPAVREAVQRAIDQDIPVQVRGVRVRDGDPPHLITLEVLPIQGPGYRSRWYLVLFVPEPGPAMLRDPEAATDLTADEKDRAIAQLQQDLDSTRLHLQSLVEDRDVKNQDLISANEEIQSANEELQSSNEELETTKEEVQSANEELQTVNEELQQRNAKLMQTSNDLSNLLTSVNIPLLILSSDMEIRQFTPPTQKIFNLRQTDIGRPINDIRHNLKIDDLRPYVQEVLDSLGTRELEVQDLDDRWYLVRIRVYRTTENKIEGTVIVLLDIDQVRRAQEELRVARDYGVAVIESMPVPVVVLTTELAIRTVNSAFRTLSGMSAAELENRSLPELANLLWGLERLRERLDVLRKGGESASIEFEHETGGPDSRSFELRARNLRHDSSQVILFTIEETTARKTAERVLALEREALEGRFESTTQALGRTQDELRALTASLFRAQDDERRWVSRELHDDIIQKLAFLDMEMQGFEQLENNPEEVRRRAAELRQRTTLLAGEVRRISHRLHPAIVDDLGMAPALRSLVEEFGERESMLATFASRNVPGQISREVTRVFYRIAQEALRNVAKHAGKTHVKVTLEGEDNRLRLEVADLGEGFDPEGVRRGLGLIGMAERARLINGVLTVESALGRGTTVAVEAPLEEEQPNG
jgi:two-component system CheB/CheR fusion protein